MKKNKSTIQIVIVVVTFLIMALAVWAVFTGRMLTQDEAMDNIQKGMIEKLR